MKKLITMFIALVIVFVGCDDGKQVANPESNLGGESTEDFDINAYIENNIDKLVNINENDFSMSINLTISSGTTKNEHSGEFEYDFDKKIFRIYEKSDGVIDEMYFDIKANDLYIKEEGEFNVYRDSADGIGIDENDFSMIMIYSEEIFEDLPEYELIEEDGYDVYVFNINTAEYVGEIFDFILYDYEDSKDLAKIEENFVAEMKMFFKDNEIEKVGIKLLNLEGDVDGGYQKSDVKAELSFNKVDLSFPPANEVE